MTVNQPGNDQWTDPTCSQSLDDKDTHYELEGKRRPQSNASTTVLVIRNPRHAMLTHISQSSTAVGTSVKS